MYHLILKALYLLNNLKTDEERAQYLQSLKPTAKSLRSGFNPFAGPNVNVDYRSKVVQSAYMLRYFPQYSLVIRLILNKLKSGQILLPFDQEEISACFFGAGPSPEVYGFIQFLNGAFRHVCKVTAYTFDIISDDWAYARDITENYLIPAVWQQREFELINNNFDLSQANSIRKLTGIINSSSLVIFQNCLNEINQKSYPNVIGNLNSLVRAMRAGSILMIIDLSSYQAASNLVSQIESSVQAQNSVTTLIGLTESASRYDAVALRNELPLIIKQNLLTGEDGLIPRRNINYHCLVIRKD